MSRHDDNAIAFLDLVADMLAETRGWTRDEKTEHGQLMLTPDGGTRLLVTRIWGDPVSNSDIARNAARYAAHHGHQYGGAVLALLSTLGDLGWAYVRESTPFNLEVLDEPHIAGLAGTLGTAALERYADILRNQGYGRHMLPRDKWVMPKRQGRHPALAITAAEVRTLREAEGISMSQAKERLMKDRFKSAVAQLRTEKDWDLLVDVIEALVDNASIRS